MKESLETREETVAALRKTIDRIDLPFDVLVLPELALSGLVTSDTQARSLAEVIRDSESVKLLTALARDNDAFVVTSIVEQDSGRMYNTALLVGSEGLVGSYRKVHLSMDDRAWASPGDGGFPVFDIPAGRVGLMVGHDAMFPEAARAFGVKGADLICVPAALKYPGPRAWGPPMFPSKSLSSGKPTTCTGTCSAPAARRTTPW